ncbi:MAG TPA: winged helix-turn-helix domain-containing protein [Terriglobales bacterium]|nr:winged helix-turn-helix domain-containing protein [Terriglobales bacterium]
MRVFFTSSIVRVDVKVLGMSLALGPVRLRRTLLYLVSATRGGPARAKIITTLKDEPMNVNQLAERLGHDYSTIKHHLDVLRENKLVEVAGGKYGQLYFLSSDLQENYGIFIEILGKSGKTQT